jgi:type VI protein secretion system component Hcp
MFRLIIATFVFLTFVGASSIQAQKLLLRLGDTGGSSTNTDHKGWIPITGSSLGLVAPVRGVRQPSPLLHLSRPSDAATPKLAVATATGTNLGTATLEWIGRAEGSTAPKTLYSISLTEVTITNWEQSTDSKGPQEVLSLAFRLLRMQVPIVKPENEPPASSSTTVEPATAVALTDVMGRGEWAPGGTFKLYWPGLTGHVYQILSSPTVDGDFSLLQEISTPATGEASVELPRANPTHFFRILQVEKP